MREADYPQGYGTALGVITNLFETGRLERAYYTQSTRESRRR